MNRRKFKLTNLLYNKISASINRIDYYDTEVVINFVGSLSKFLWKYHTGVYRDVSLDKLINRIFKDEDYLPKGYSVENSIIHVVTELYPTGGHTEFLINFLNATSDYNHFVILTSQTSKLPSRFEDLTINSNITIIKLISDTIYEKIIELRRTIKGKPGIILLSTHPDDLIPQAALGKNIEMPVILFNHADHIHWLGAEVTDVVLNFRNVGVDICRKYRGLENSRKLFLMPRSAKNNLEKTLTKNDFIIDSFEKVCLTICAEYKINPLGEQNFYKFLKNAAIKFPKLGFVVVGPTGNIFKKLYPDINLPNVIFTGKKEDISQLLAVSDIYLDPFPLSSVMALYEAVSHGLFPVISPYPLSKLFSSEFEFEEAFFNNISVKLTNPEEYYIEVLEFILSRPDDFNSRRELLLNKFNSKYNSENFNEEITKLVNSVKGIKHQVNSCEQTKDESLDSVLLNSVIVDDIDEMFSDFIKLSKFIPKFQIIIVYIFFSFYRLLIKERKSFKRPTVFLIRRIFKSK